MPNYEQLDRELTFGERAVGISFNPSQNPEVREIKEKSATLIDLLHAARTQSLDPEKGRMFSLAITELQTAQMWAVKAITWNL